MNINTDLNIDWVNITQLELDAQLLSWVTKCVKYNNRDALKLIFETLYDKLPIERGQLDHLSRFYCQEIDNDILIFVSTTLKPNVSELYLYLIDYDGLPMTMIGAKNLDIIFNPNIKLWRRLYEAAVENEEKKGYTNKQLKYYIETKLRELLPYKSKPKYIIPTNLDCKQLHDIELDFDKSMVLNPKMNKHELLKKIRLSMIFDDELFKRFGPSNTSLDEDLTDNHICTIYGGHRMFLCNEFEDVYVDDEIVDNDNVNYDKITSKWFTGSCDTCFKPIRHSHYAVRVPIVSGGWIGCYCSWKCVKVLIGRAHV